MSSTSKLTATELAAYRADGFVIRPAVFSGAECEAFVEHMMDLHAGRMSMAGFEARESDNWGRTMNQHLWDPAALDLLLHPRLREPLAQCFGGEPEAIQTMYFWKGSTQRRHQDAFYLPECMSAWIALTDVGPDNGTIWVQPGSHQSRLVTKEDFAEKVENAVQLGTRYNDRIDELYEENGHMLGKEEVPVYAERGSVVFFHGALIHKGGPVGDPDSFRHVMACHYIPRASTAWPYPDWPRFTFDGDKRFGN